MHRIYLWLILPISLLFISVNSHSKNACEKQLNKLQQIQVKQRQGYSIKRSRILNEQERKASKQLWQCKKSPTKKTKKSKKSKKNAKSKTNQSTVKKYKLASKTPVLISSGAISVKEKYQGKKKLCLVKLLSTT